MRETTNECVDCGLPCQGEACPYYRVTRFYCDKCKNEEVLYETEDGELCADCVLKLYNKVEGSDY